MFSANDIREIEFETEKRGYNIEDVRAFLSQIAGEIEQLVSEKSDAENKMRLLAGKIEEYRQNEDKLRAALLSAQKMCDSMLQDAKQRAEMMLREANLKAERIVGAAEQRARQQESALSSLQKEVSKFKADVLFAYRQHLELLSLIPGTENDAEKSFDLNRIDEIAGNNISEAVASQIPVSSSENTATFNPVQSSAVPEFEAAAKAPAASPELPKEYRPQSYQKPSSNGTSQQNHFGTLDFGGDFQFNI